jgi:hypothetical protein
MDVRRGGAEVECDGVGGDDDFEMPAYVPVKVLKDRAGIAMVVLWQAGGVGVEREGT